MSIYKKEYDTLLMDEKRRRERNIRLLARLENIEKKAAFLQAKTDRIKSLKKIYKNQYGNDIPTYKQSTYKTHENNYNNFEERKPNIDSCHITKNITLEEAIEELSKRFVLIPKTANQKTNSSYENQTKEPKYESFYNIKDDKFEEKPSKSDKEIIHSSLDESVNKEIREIQEINNDDSLLSETVDKIQEIGEEKDKNNDDTLLNLECTESSKSELTNVSFQPEFEGEPEKCVEIFNEPEQIEEEKPKTNPKLSNLSSEIAHVDEMGIDTEKVVNDTNINAYENINETEEYKTELYENDNENNYEEKQMSDAMEKTENQDPNYTEQNEYQNQNEENYDNQYVDNTNLNQEIPNYSEENPNAAQEINYEQQYYDNTGGNDYYDQTMVDQTNEGNVEYNTNIDESQISNETNAQPEQYYEDPQYAGEQTQQYYEQTDNQNYENQDNYVPNNVEDNNAYSNYQEQAPDQEIPNNENVYEQQQSEVAENYDYGNQEATPNVYDENNTQEYQQYEGQNVNENEQYNYNYENQEDSQQYDTSAGDITQSNVEEPQADYQEEAVKPLQIFDSDVEQASAKEENSVPESDFDFSAQ